MSGVNVLPPRPDIRTRVATGHAGFDAAANHPVHGYVGTGNVMSNVQLSGFIRAHGATECNGFSFEPGALQASDLRVFNRIARSGILSVVRTLTATHGGIFYAFFHPPVSGPRVVHGFILTDRRYLVESWWVTGPTAGSRGIIQAMLARVAHNVNPSLNGGGHGA